MLMLMCANMRSTQPSLQSAACSGRGRDSLSAAVVLTKLVCAPTQYGCLLFNDKLMHSDNMEEGCLASCFGPVLLRLYSELAQQLLSQLDLVGLKCLRVLCPAD